MKFENYQHLQWAIARMLRLTPSTLERLILYNPNAQDIDTIFLALILSWKRCTWMKCQSWKMFSSRHRISKNSKCSQALKSFRTSKAEYRT